MIRLFFYSFFFLVLITLVFSEPSPLRGTLKESESKSNSESLKNGEKAEETSGSNVKNENSVEDNKESLSEETHNIDKANQQKVNSNVAVSPEQSKSNEKGKSLNTKASEKDTSDVGKVNANQNQENGGVQGVKNAGDNDAAVGKGEDDTGVSGDDVGSGSGSGAGSSSGGSSSGGSSSSGNSGPNEEDEETSGAVTPTTSASTNNGQSSVSTSTESSPTTSSLEKPTTEDSKCGDTFIMWFAEGIAVTTIKCDKYSVIYTGNESGEPKPKYIKGEVQNVEVSGRTVSVNEKNLSTISEDPNEPTDTSQNSAEARLLANDDETLKNVEVYSFPIGNREITVKLPNSNEAGKRDKYTLSSGDETFYSGSENNSKYSIKDNGDLVDSTGKVVLKGDSSSSAIKNIYSVSCLFAILISVLMF